MAKDTRISWTQSTWNPWSGCLKVSPGCKNCYMYRDKARFKQDPKVVVRSKTTFKNPLKWKNPALVFTCSWSDFFIPEADEWRAEAWEIIRATPHLTYQILTKRPELVAERLPKDWGDGYGNVWLGVSVESQAFAWRASEIATVPAKVRFISAEPLLGPVKLPLEGIHWVITGGESGPNARPMLEEWALSVRDQCALYGVAFFHKQNGGKFRNADGEWGGKLLNGQVYEEFPK